MTEPCGSCGKVGWFSAPVAVVLVFAPSLPRPYPLLPAELYTVCCACDAVFSLVQRAVEAHPLVRGAGPWTRAVVVFDDGHGVEVKAKRAAVATA